MRWLVVLFSAVYVCLLEPALAQQTLKLSTTLTLEKDDDKVKTHEQVTGLLAYAKEKKLQSNVLRFLENMVGQLDKVLEAAKVLEQKKLTEVPKDFTPAKYRVKAMPKLQAKKSTVKKMTAKELKKKLQDGGNLNFDAPMLVTNATALFEDGAWDTIRRQWYAGRIAADEQLEKDFRVEYWPPDKARARLVGNMLHMEEPELVTFSRYLVICFHGTPAKPKLPGQNTEHCEQNVDATRMASNASELKQLQIFPEIKNILPIQADFKRRLMEAGAEELPAIMGNKGAEKWKKQTGRMQYQHFTFGPSGSGDKLHAEDGLPFFDILIHGSRRWLLLKEEEMQRVADKAREALEFDKTSAYMFFEEKLPELKEEFGLKKYVECNQNAGDLVIVPPSWFRVSLSLADSISYYETLMSEKSTLDIVTDNNVWRPQFRQYQLAFCYNPEDISKLPGTQDPKFASWLAQAMKQVKVEELINGIMNVLFTCGSVLALEGVLPNLKGSVGVCTPAVWKQCRKQLKAKIDEKPGATASLDWLPKEAVRSPDLIGKASAKTEL